MHHRSVCLLLLACLCAAACSAAAVADPAPLTYSFTAGKGGSLSFAPPVLREVEFQCTAPPSYQPNFDNFDLWPGRQGKNINLISLHPKYDEDNILILGGLFRAVLPESVVITSKDGKTTYKLNTDYRIHDDWGQVAAINDRLGEPGKAELNVRYQYATQRLDLVQSDSAGNLSVKQGEPRMVCPPLPQADPGHTAIAGVYIAPWRRDGQWKIAAEDVYPIHPLPPVQPIGVENIARTRAKLAAGQTVRIAFIGDSITLGAESGQWWDKDVAYTAKDRTWRGRFIYQLGQHFHKATIQPIEAFKGGEGTPYGVKILQDTVIPANPDLVIITLGTNDVYSAIGKEPKTPLPDYRKAITDMVTTAHQHHIEVVLVVAMPLNPWMKNGADARWPSYRQALLDIGKSEGCAVADVCTEWRHMADRGIPPYSQLHNWINHPGPEGHALFADTVLRCFTVSQNSDKSEIPQNSQTTNSALLTQPTEIPGKWSLGQLQWPDAAPIIAAPGNTQPLYGVYTWAGEYRTFRKQIKDVGWHTVRIGGPMDDQTMTMIANDGIEVMQTISGKGNRSRYDTDDAYIASCVKNAETYLTRYGPGGTFFTENPGVPVHPVTHIEILNEPNFQYMIPPRPGVNQKTMEAERFALYAKLLPAVYKAVKEKWPRVTVVGFAAGGSGSGDVRYIAAVHEADPAVSRSYDVLSTHPYMDNVPPETYSVHSWGKYSIVDNLAAIRRIMSLHHTADRPVWYTECGWRISKEDGGRYNQPADAVTTPLLQAAYTCRLYAMASRLNVARVTNMFITDTDNYNGGFFNRDTGAYRASADAVKQMIALMPNPKLLTVVSETPEGVYAYEFAPNAAEKQHISPVMMAWSVTGHAELSLDWPEDSATVIDMLGHRQQLQRKDGKITVTLGPCPIYITR